MKIDTHGRGIRLDEARNVREFWFKVTQLRIYRAKGYCELCHRFFGTTNRHIKGHHKKRIADGGDDSDSNIIITCESCYLKMMKGKPDVRMR